MAHNHPCRISPWTVLCTALFALGVEGIFFTESFDNYNLTVGQTATITWNYLYGQATLTLGGRSPNNTNFNITIAGEKMGDVCLSEQALFLHV